MHAWVATNESLVAANDRSPNLIIIIITYTYINIFKYKINGKERDVYIQSARFAVAAVR